MSISETNDFMWDLTQDPVQDEKKQLAAERKKHEKDNRNANRRSERRKTTAILNSQIQNEKSKKTLSGLDQLDVSFKDLLPNCPPEEILRHGNTNLQDFALYG